MMNKIVYIIVPVFNVASYLSKCLDSIFSQSYSNCFVVCVDDGSTDDSLNILKHYEKSHQNMVVICKDNGGLSSARNAGLDYLSNKNGLLTFVDSDDWLDKEYIFELVNLLCENDVDIVCSSFLFASDNQNLTHAYRNYEKDIVITGNEATNILVRDETIQSHAWSKLYKLDLFKGVRFDESITYMEDQCTTFKLLYKSNKVMITNYAGYYYYQSNDNSLTKTLLTNKKVCSALKSYYLVCLYDFANVDKNLLLSSAQNALGAAFLMLIPYFNKKKATNDEIQLIKAIKRYIKTNKIIRKYVPNNSRNSIKKIMFVLCPVLYCHIFKITKRLARF